MPRHSKGNSFVTINVTVRQAIGPQDAAHRDTAALRAGFLVENLFRPGEINLVYSHLDRMILGGVVPAVTSLILAAVKETGTDTFLERRELVVLNVGGRGSVAVGSTEYDLDKLEALYVGRGAGPLEFSSRDASLPAQFYLVSTPAHRDCPVAHVTLDDFDVVFEDLLQKALPSGTTLVKVGRHTR